MKSRFLLCGLLAGATLTRVIVASAAFTESPELRQLVEAGKLPPLEQRLPIAPLIITPIEKPGVYGGTWRMVLVGYDASSMFDRSLAYENLVRWDPNWTRVVPNVASSWAINADATVYRFQLRHGLRWSDGVPFTAQDIVAWFDDIVRDRAMTAVPPGWLVVNGQLPECTAPDEFSVEFKFAAPNALFLEQLAGMRARELTHYPAHYFRKPLPPSSPTNPTPLEHRVGTSWPWQYRSSYDPWSWHQAGVPTLDAWCITNAYTPGNSSVIAVRNPYYWKVDTRGRQLPYLDQVQFEVVADGKEALRRALAGEVDYQRQDFVGGNAATLRAVTAAESEGRIRTVRVIPSRSNPLAICLNLTHPDPGMRAVLSDKRVRIALSEALNRPLLNQQLYAGEGRPWQVAPRPESPFYNRKLAEQYTGFAPDRARAALEAAGLHARDADGLRFLPDGRPFRLTILVPSPVTSAWSVILNQVKSDWLSIGVAMDWTAVPLTDFFVQIGQNKHDGAVIKATGGYTAILEPDFFVPVSFENTDQAFYAIPWARWFINPKAAGAEAPPASVQTQMNLFRRVIAEPDRDTRITLMKQVLAMAADEFYVIGTCLEPVRLAIRSPRFRNVPTSHFDSWLYPDPGPFNPCQFYQEPVTSPAP